MSNATPFALGVGGGFALWLLAKKKNAAHAAPAARRCVVWIRANAVEVDGVAADLPTVIARCRTAGAAEVHATGDAITGVVRNVLEALHAAGVTLYTPPDLTHIVPSERPR